MPRVNSADTSNGRSVGWIMLIYFASGACSLIDEVVWVRLLKLTLGNTVYASSVVVSVFMGGLALGALVMGRYADRVKNRLRLYALLETLVTISALSLPLLLKLADNVYVWFYQSFSPGRGPLLVIQVVVSAGVVLVPSMLMGSTLPLLGRFVTSLEKETGHLVGRLYALNTLGAAAGCFAAGFVLIRVFGVMGTLYIAAGLNILVAFGGWFLSRSCKVKSGEQPAAAARDGGEIAPVVKAGGGKFYLLVFAFFMSGLISIAYELLWMRSIVHLVGGTTYVFSAVLTVYLLGYVVGVGFGSRLAKRLKNPAVGFAVTLSLLGLCGVFYMQTLIYWMSTSLPAVNKWLEASTFISPFMTKPLVQSFFLFLVPAMIMGLGFPIALQAWTNHMHKVGRSTGTAYGANTIGAVVGGIVTGFVLIPYVGLQGGVSILGLLGVWIGAVMCLTFVTGPKVVRRVALLGVAVVLTVVTIKGPSNLFERVVELNPTLPGKFKLVTVREGITTSVSVHQHSIEKTMHIHSSGQSIAGDSYVERGDQKMLGHFSILLNSDAEKVLSVGFGSGETTACLAMHKLERVDCVEIAPEVVDVSLQYFSHINLGDRLDQEINMIFMDAKNYLHLTDSKYDVIVNDSIHPRDFAENASLYTKEYFEVAKEHLNTNGMILSWIPTYDIPASVFNSIIGTLLEVFPHVTVWYLTPQPAPLVLVAGSEQQQMFSIEHIEARLQKEAVGANLADIDVHDSVDVLSCYIADETDLRKHISDYSLNSDFWPFVEFTTDQRTPSREVFREFVLDLRSQSVYNHIDWTGIDDEEKANWLGRYQELYKVSSYLFMALGSKNQLDKLKYCMEGLAISPKHQPLLDARSNAEKILFSNSIGLILSGNGDRALGLANEMLKIHERSATAWMIRSGVMRSGNNLERALVAAQQATILAPKQFDVRLNHGSILAQLKRFEEAIKEYRTAMQLNPDQAFALESLALALIADRNGASYDPAESIDVAQRACELTDNKNAQMLNTLSMAYAAAGRFDDAVSTAEKAIDVANSSGQKKLAEQIGNRLLLLKAERKSL